MRLSSLTVLSVLTLAVTTACVEKEAETGGEGGTGGVGGGEAVGASGGGEEAPGGAAEGGAPPVEVLAEISLRDGFGEPAVGLNVIANAPDGSLVAAGVSDEGGSVALTIPAGGSVSAVYTSTYQYADPDVPPVITRKVETISFSELPNESIRINVVGSSSAPPQSAPMTIQVAVPQALGATSYDVSSSCANSLGNTGSVVTLATSNCRSDNKLDLVMVARNASGAIVDHARLDNVPFVPGGSQSYGLAWEEEPVGSVSFAVTNIPEGSPGLSLYSGAHLQGAGGTTSASSSASIWEPPNQVTTTLSHLDGYGNDHCQSIHLLLPDDGETFLSASRQRCAVLSVPSITLDAARLARFEPTIGSLAPLALELGESWSGELGQVVSVEHLWEHNGESSLWGVHVEPGSSGARFPELPAALAEYALAADDQFIQATAVHVQDLGGLKGFSAAVEAGLPLTSRNTEAVKALYEPR